VRRATTRQWLIYRHSEWWLIGLDGLPVFCRAHDLTAAEMDGDQWTTLPEDCVAEKQLTQLVTPEWRDDVRCSDPAGSAPEIIVAPEVIPEEAIVTPTTSTLTTVPGTGLAGLSASGDSSSGDSSSSGGGGGGSSGGELLGGGNGSAPSGGGGVFNTALPGGVAGGGGGGGGSSPATPPEEEDVVIDPEDVFVATVEIIQGYKMSQTGTGCKVIWMWRASYTADEKYANESFSTRIITAGVGVEKCIFSGWLKPGHTIEGLAGLDIPVPVGGDAYLVLQMTVKSKAQTIAGNTSASLHILNNFA
jgi:hypothetical protein